MRRGLLRLGIALCAVWFVFWTFAYVLDPQTSHSPAPGSPLALAIKWNVSVPCLVTILLLGCWVAAGFLDGEAMIPGAETLTRTKQVRI